MGGSIASVIRGLVSIAAIATIACGGPPAAPAAVSAAAATIQVTGSDTMINLLQAWAETYDRVRPDVAVRVVGGGSGVGIAALIDGVADVAASSREMSDGERRLMSLVRGAPQDAVVALDALAVYVHRSNPLAAITMAQLAGIYGDGGAISRWSELGATIPRCRGDRIIRVGRQNSSGTYLYFRDAVLGPRRDYKLGSIDQSGSKDVVALVSRTPCAVGYSGLAYATAGVKALAIAAGAAAPVQPTASAVVDGSYVLARRLYFYTAGAPNLETARFVAWVLGSDGQRLARDLGFVAVGIEDE
jgi:phosphate transport system substrate-binding protein